MESSSSQKLDNSRMHRNNAANALSTSSSSSSSSSVSMTLDAGPEKQPLGSIGGCHQMPTMTLSGLTVEGSDDEELKAKEKFQNNLGNNELHKDYKKRRPLTVLKNHNVQCLPGSYSSAPTRGTSLSLAPNSLFIPNDQLSHDAKQLSGYKYVVPGKSDMKKNPFPAVSREQLQLDSSSDSVKQETKSHKETSGTASKGKSKHTENPKHSKRKAGSSSAVSAEADETPVEMTVTKEPPSVVGHKRLSGSDSIDHRPPPLSSTSPPLCVSSRRSKKQNKQKDTTHTKIPDHIDDNPSLELNRLSDIAPPELANVNSKTSSKLRHSVKEHSIERSSKKEKDKKFERMKSNCVWPSGYASTSGVAELDTFEITSIQNQRRLATKRLPTDKHITDHSQVSSSNEVNALDTFDEPVAPRPVARRSVDASSSSLVQQKQRDVAEKWIQVNRKVKRVVVPSSVVSHILGSNGSKLEAICRVTRAHIELEKTTNPGEMTFVLRGTLEQMQAASNMISALMNSKSPSDSGERETIVAHSKNGSPLHLPPQPVTTSKEELKMSLKLGQLTVPVIIANNASSEKSPPPPQSAAEVTGFGQNDDDYPDSILSSASERSDPCSERCSPAQDLLIGEYSLFEHGLGQPLEKLLARKDSSKQTFAAAIRMPNRTLTPIIPNRSAIDQLLLAKAPGYRNAKAIYGHRGDACFAKAAAADLGSQHMPTGRFDWPPTMVISGRGLERRATKENDPFRSTASQLFDSSNAAHIPPLERPLSAPGFPSSAHSPPSSSAALPPAAHDRSTALADHLLTVQTFSSLNPNAPDFVFNLPLEEASGSRIGGGMLSLEPCGSQLLRSPVNPPPLADGSGCPTSTDGSAAGEFSYSMSRLSGTFDSVSVDVPDSSPCVGSVSQAGGFTLAGLTADDGMYVPPPLGGDNLNAPWLYSPEPWLPSKISYSGMGRGEHVLPGTAACIAPSYPSRGELYRNYFAHPPFSPITSSPYNCAFYQQHQQNIVLAPVQSWSHAAQTPVAQAGP